ncbi:MAG TPA: preprotein translocase subunit SecE [Gaiellaceae bacterium]|jgi:preprotein translocase subunit SecE|nr:preprotein translocase subunit SecE [Gaiellaceae bacterium]
MARSSRTRRGRRGADYQAPAVKSRTREERRPEPVPVEAPAGAPAEPARVERGRGGFLGFTQESWAELKKVDWPGQRQLISATVAVIVAVAVVGVFLWASDAVLSRLVRDVILNI